MCIVVGLLFKHGWVRTDRWIPGTTFVLIQELFCEDWDIESV